MMGTESASSADQEHRLRWQLGTVTAVSSETPRVKTLTIALPFWEPHRAGQHYDLRLTAEDGYQAQRSYSVASAPERTGAIDLTIERLDDGEVSPYLCDGVAVGDQLEVRGPIGGYFVWTATQPQPLLLVGGGSGVVPLMAMLRHRAARQSPVPVRLLYSSRSLQEVIYHDELARCAADRSVTVIPTYTRMAPDGWPGYARRIDAAMLREVTATLPADALAYVCGPTLLVELVAQLLVEQGWSAERIFTERFGPSGAA